MKTIFTLLAVYCISFVAASQDSQICSLTTNVLKQMNKNVTNVTIADGTSKGGSRVMIISYKVNYDSDKHAGELTEVLECGYAANENLDAKLDEITAIASSNSGSTLAVINTKIFNTGIVLKTKNTTRYIESWNVIRYDKNFLPTVLSKARQIKQ